MKQQKSRHVRNLWFRYVKGTALESLMHADDVADCLSLLGFITLCDKGSRYLENESLYALTDAGITKILTRYAAGESELIK